MDQNKIIDALYAAIFQGVNLPQGSNAPVVSFERPGLPIDPVEYSNPWSSENQNGNPRALETFSALVDLIPYPGPVFWPNGCSVEALYGLMVESTAGVVDSVTAKAFNTAKFKYESTSRVSLEFPPLTYHPSYPSPFRWCDQDVGWTEMTADA